MGIWGVWKPLTALFAGAFLAGCATTPPYVQTTVTTDGAMAKNASEQQFAWVLTEAQREDPITRAIISEITGYLVPHGYVEAANSEDAHLLIAIRSDIHFEEDQVTLYTVNRYVPGPSHSYQREVEVYDYSGTYLGTQREYITERSPGRTVQEQRKYVSDGYERLIEISFISAEDFREAEAAPFYTIRAVSEGTGDTIGRVGRCMVEVIFQVFPQNVNQPYTNHVIEEHENYCHLEGF